MWIAAIAPLAEAGDPWSDVEARLGRELAVDELAGDRPSEADFARHVDLASIASDTALQDRLSPYFAPRNGPSLAVSPAGSLAIGTLVPIDASGDPETGLVSPRIGGEALGWWGPIEARVVADPGLDAIPRVAPRLLGQWRLGVRLGHGKGTFHAAVAQESRFFGPGRSIGLLMTDNGLPLPGLDVGGDFRLPGKAAKGGRFGVELLAGVVPGSRTDAVAPGWLVLDLRYAPLPWIELGLTRNAMFAGRSPVTGAALPVDWGQVILPTHPHVYDDPTHATADTDERASVDVRVTVPIRKLTGFPVDDAGLFWQQGGEDVIARHAGPIPVPSLAGIANLYGGNVDVGPFVAEVELAVVEDDVYRWYTGHRVYHEGWTEAGRVLGDPWGGDSRALHVEVGRASTAGFSARATWDHVERWLVADLVGDKLFVFDTPERRDDVGIAASRIGRTGTWTVQVDGGRVIGVDFAADATALEGRVAVAWQGPRFSVRSAGGRPLDRRDPAP